MKICLVCVGQLNEAINGVIEIDDLTTPHVEAVLKKYMDGSHSMETGTTSVEPVASGVYKGNVLWGVSVVSGDGSEEGEADFEELLIWQAYPTDMPLLPLSS